jgi:arabinose-5-phosphate isomerase
MNNKMSVDIIEHAKQTLMIESQAIVKLIDRLNNSFKQAVELLYNCKGRVVITGMGKSGIIGKKIAATLASTGTPAIFLHPAEAAHGDLGMVVSDDIIIAISNSGETKEINELMIPIKRKGATIIALTGNLSSTLAKHSDIVIDVSVEKEACPLGLVPTASTTATLAMGDAIAVALLAKRGFKEEDFALLHPGGSIGRRLWLTVGDLMHTGEQIPIVFPETCMKDAIFEITSKKLGVTIVTDKENNLVGIITDGDLRRLVEKKRDIWDIMVKDVMTKNPKTIKKSELAIAAIAKMEHYAITSLVITDDKNKVIGIIHLHDLLKAGIA